MGLMVVAISVCSDILLPKRHGLKPNLSDIVMVVDLQITFKAAKTLLVTKPNTVVSQVYIPASAELTSIIVSLELVSSFKSMPSFFQANVVVPLVFGVQVKTTFVPTLASLDAGCTVIVGAL